MDWIKEYLKLIRDESYIGWINRLCNYYTVIVLMILSLTVGLNQLVGSPVQCWVPKEFSDAWEQYAETFCFVQSTYYVPTDLNLPNPADRIPKINYYQWVPFALLVQSALFYTPHLIWRWLSGSSSISLETILNTTKETVGAEADKRQQRLKTLIHVISVGLKGQTSLGKRTDIGSYCCALFGIDHIRGTGNYLTVVQVIVKILNFVNVIGQLLFIDAFLGGDGWFWGGRILSDAVNGRQWMETGRFPRMTMCDFDIRHMGEFASRGKKDPNINAHRYTTQCVLTINLWNEKIYLFLWLWMVFLAVCTCWNLLGWLYGCCCPSWKRQIIKKYLLYGLPDDFDMRDGRIFDYFMRDVMKSDGVLLMRYISDFAGDFMATEITVHLFMEYASKYNERRGKIGCPIQIENDHEIVVTKIKHQPQNSMIAA